MTGVQTCALPISDKELITRYSDEVLKKLRNVEIEEEKLQFNLRQYGRAEQKEV